MHTLSKTEFVDQALPTLLKIFKDINPYGEPFASNVEDKLILHEYWYVMEPPLLDAVVAASYKFNETGFFVTIFHENQIEDQMKHQDNWYISLERVS